MLEITINAFNGGLGTEKYKLTVSDSDQIKEEYAKNYFVRESEKFLADFLNLKITSDNYYNNMRYLINNCYVGYYNCEKAKIEKTPFSFQAAAIADNEKRIENIKINEKNISKINTACKVANGKATTRLLNYSDIFEIASEIINYLRNDLELTKKELFNIVIEYDNSEKLPKAYKYNATGTQATFTFDKAGNIILTKVFRDTINKYTDKKYRYIFTEQAKKAILINLSTR